MNKKIYLSFYAASNLGDDLFVHSIAQAFPDVQFLTLASPKYNIKDKPSNVKNVNILASFRILFEKCSSLFSVHFISRTFRHLSKHIEALVSSRCDAIVSIGGSVYFEHSDFEEFKIIPANTVPCGYSPHYQILPGKKHFLIGCNFGPYIHDSFLEQTKSSLSYFAAVSFRDFSSYYLFKDLPNVLYAPDVLFSNSVLSNHQTGKQNNTVCISVISPQKHGLQKYETKYYSLLADLILELDRRGFSTVLMSFCKIEGDEEAERRILSLLEPFSNVELCNYRGDSSSIIKKIANCRFVIASRFHSMILGFIFHKPVFPIAYSCKTINYLRDMNFSGRYSDIHDIDSLNIDDILYNLNNSIVCDCETHSINAKHHFGPLTDYLYGGKYE